MILLLGPLIQSHVLQFGDAKHYRGQESEDLRNDFVILLLFLKKANQE